MAGTTRRKARAGRKAPRAPTVEKYLLRLFVTGTTPQSMRAIVEARELCEQHFRGRYRLEVVDIHQQPRLARREDIFAIPTLVKRRPPPPRKLVGTFTDRQRVLRALQLGTVEPPDPPRGGDR